MPPPTDTVPPTDRHGAPPTDTVPPPTRCLHRRTRCLPTDTVPPPTDTVPPPTERCLHRPRRCLHRPRCLPTEVPDDRCLPRARRSPPVRHTVPWESGTVTRRVPVASPTPVSDALVTVAFGSPRSSAPAVNDPPGAGRAGPHIPEELRGSLRSPAIHLGPLPPLRRPQVPVALRVEAFFFSGFAALVAAVCFGLARRSTKRLIMSVAAWEPVAFVSLPERPG